MAIRLTRPHPKINARVYALFGLADAEIALIKVATKYQYGEV